MSQYPCVTLYNNGHPRKEYVHRLVAFAFCEQNGGNQVNHINGDPLDNRACNLEWCNQAHNVRHAVETGLVRKRGSQRANSKLTESKVRDMRSRRPKQTYESIAGEFGISIATAWKICNGKAWRHVS